MNIENKCGQQHNFMYDRSMLIMNKKFYTWIKSKNL